MYIDVSVSYLLYVNKKNLKLNKLQIFQDRITLSIRTGGLINPARNAV